MKRFLTAIVLAAASTVACAQEADMQTVFGDLDTDDDGYLSAKELQVSADLKLKLEHMDSDGDGKVSRDEFVAAFQEGSPSGPAGPTGAGSPR